MNPIEAVVVMALIGLPLHMVVASQLGKLADPDYLRDEGVVILRPEVLEGHTSAIGRYRNTPIWGTVTFMGMRYRFDRVAPRSYRWAIGARELFLDPGLVYVTD